MKKGFTLVELLAVIAILGLVLAISVPKVLTTMKDADKKAFKLDAQMALKTMELKLAQGLKYDITTVNVDTIKSVFGINNKNFSSVIVTYQDGIPYITIDGKNSWDGLMAYGTKDNMTVTDSTTIDITAPVITLIGSANIYVEQGATYNETGALATDEKDGDISNKITITGTVNTSVIGVYEKTYSVSDFAGNSSSIKRTINVITNANPVVTFDPNGNSTYAQKHSPLVTVTDNSGVNASSLEYQWTTSTTAPTEASFTQPFVNGTAVSSPNGLSGSYYLWILAKDIVGNTTITRSNVFNLTL